MVDTSKTVMQDGVMTRANPTYEEDFTLKMAKGVRFKYNIMPLCPRCNSELEFIEMGTWRIVQCKDETCIGIIERRTVPYPELPKFVPCNYALFNGVDLYGYEPLEYIIGEKPGFGEFISIKPNAPQWAFDEYEALKVKLEETKPWKSNPTPVLNPKHG